MSKWLPTPRAGLALLFLFFGLVFIFVDRRTYLHYALKPIEMVHCKVPAATHNTVQARIKELKSKLAKRKIGAGRYAVAAEKNLFSPQRKAWQPPPPPQPVAKGNEGNKEAVKTPPPIRRDVILYGTYIAGKKKKAMLYFKRFRQGHLRLAEGDEARDPAAVGSRRHDAVYTVVRIEPRRVWLRDARGQEFEVGLYDNKRRRPVRTTVRKQPNIQVLRSSPGAHLPVTADKKGNGALISAFNSGKKPGRSLTAREIRKLSREEKEALVSQGILKKLSTPFGPVYRRAK